MYIQPHKTKKKISKFLFAFVLFGCFFGFLCPLLLMGYSMPHVIKPSFPKPIALRSLLQKGCLMNSRSNFSLVGLLSFPSSPQSLDHYKILISISITNL